MKELDSLFQDYFEKENLDESIYQSIEDIIIGHKIKEKQSKYKIVVNLLANIIAYHRVGPNFAEKFEKIIQLLDLFQTYNSNLIFKIFRFSRRCIYYFFKKELIKPNDQMLKEIIKNNMQQFFYQYIPTSLYYYKKCCNRLILYNQPDADEKLDIGENELPICSLIRRDSVEEFVTYVSKNNFNLETTINPSIFETNPFLCGKTIKLIEYAAFFGSIQIFQYLKMNNIELESSLWEFAIHGQNPDLIHLLESLRIPIEDKDFVSIVKEAVRGHYSNVAIYLLNSRSDFIAESFYRLAYSYYSFDFFINDMKSGYIFLFACDYDYLDIAKELILDKSFEPHEKLVLTKNIFLM